MSSNQNQTIAIDFSDKNFNEPEIFSYSDNALYNLSIPLLSITITIIRLPKPDNITLFKGLLKQHILELSERGKALDYPAAVIDKLCCLHCIVIDEFIIHSLWGADAGWENSTLLSELFGLKNGGDVFFTITDKALAQSTKMADLLVLSYVFIRIGFKGRFRSREAEKLGLITKSIHQSIENHITEPDLLLSESPKIKAKKLFTGVRYFSFTILIIVSLLTVTTFFDYWYKETYSLRANKLTQIQTTSANYTLNAKSREIIYISTPEDIHSVKNLITAPISDTVKLHNVEYDPPLSVSPEQINVVQAPDKYRVQLATFTNKNNAINYLAKMQNQVHTLSMAPLAQYFIVYSVANTQSEAIRQQNFFQNEFKLSATVNKIVPVGKLK
jgi:type VI secretion system protein ImpK